MKEITKEERIDMIEIVYFGMMIAVKTINSDNTFYFQDMIDEVFSKEDGCPNYNYENLMKKIDVISQGAIKKRDIRKYISSTRKEFIDNKTFKNTILEYCNRN